MRLFIAIDIPDFINEYLKELQKLLPHGKFSFTRDFHLTLKFLGSCNEHCRKRVEKALRKISFYPFEAGLTKIGTFGGSSTRVIWVGINVPFRIENTVHEIETSMRSLGFKKENRFIPHITIARGKAFENTQKFMLDLKKISVEPFRFPVSHFYLFESKLSPKGAVHTKLAEFSSKKET